MLVFWRKNRPIHAPASYAALELALELSGAGGAMLLLLVLAVWWHQIPDLVPGLYNMFGSVEQWASKGMLLLYPSVCLFLYAGLTALAQRPELFNFPMPLRAAPGSRQYALIPVLIGWMRLQVVFFCGFLEWRTIQVAMEREQGLGMWFMPTVLILLLGNLMLSYLVAASGRALRT